MFAKKWQMQALHSKILDDQLAMMKAVIDTTKDTALKAAAQQRLQSLPEMLAKVKQQSGMTYNKDGTCEIEQPGPTGEGITRKGKWVMIENGKKVLLTQGEMKDADTIAIDKLTEDTLILTMPDGEGGVTKVTYTPAK